MYSLHEQHKHLLYRITISKAYITRSQSVSRYPWDWVVELRGSFVSMTLRPQLRGVKTNVSVFIYEYSSFESIYTSSADVLFSWAVLKYKNYYYIKEVIILGLFPKLPLLLTRYSGGITEFS